MVPWVDAIDTLRLATEEYRSRLRAVHTAAQWASPTPCVKWTVRDVADHILGGNRFTVLVLGGLPPGAAMDDVRRGDFAQDPLRAFEVSAAQQLSEFNRPGVLERVFQHPAGMISGRQIAGLRMSDLVVHAWDLARALGLPEELDELLVTESIRVSQAMGETLTATGMLGSGESGIVADHSPDQLRLLDMVGRRP
jgi:uncharacterized protein (TIGR03086 family)